MTNGAEAIKMSNRRIGTVMLLVSTGLILFGCSRIGDSFGGMFGPRQTIAEESTLTPDEATAGTPPPVRAPNTLAKRGFLGLGPVRATPGIEVNSYLWAATLDILHFLPIQSADPYTGTIVTGYGTAPGSNSAYRATVVIQSAAMDATSLHLSLMSRSGPAPAGTQQALEDAIMMRARQLRIAAQGR